MTAQKPPENKQDIDPFSDPSDTENRDSGNQDSQITDQNSPEDKPDNTSSSNNASDSNDSGSANSKSGDEERQYHYFEEVMTVLRKIGPPYVCVPIIYFGFTAILTFSLHCYLGSESKKWIHTFERESYLDELLTPLKLSHDEDSTPTDGPLELNHDEGSNPTDSLKEYIDNSVIRKIRRISVQSNNSLIFESISFCLSSYQNKNSSKTPEAEAETLPPEAEYCPRLHSEFRTADIYKEKVSILVNYLRENQNNLDKADEKRLIDTIGILLLLPNLDASEGEQARLLEQYKKVLSRQNELFERLVFNYKWNSSLTAVMHISGLIALFCFLLRNSNLLTKANDDTDLKEGKGWLTAWLITSLFFFFLHYQSSQIFRVGLNLEDGLERYQEYVNLENSIRSFVATNRVTEGGNDLKSTETNRFILSVDNQLKDLNHYALLTDGTVIDSSFGVLFNLLDSSSGAIVSSGEAELEEANREGTEEVGGQNQGEP